MSSINNLKLYSYYYSSASWRIRAYLAHKKIPFKYELVDLLNKVQYSDEFIKVNPMRQAPVIQFDDAEGKTHCITQSLAIIEFLEELHPENSILPKNLILRAKSRAIAETISGGIQPLQNLETLTKYTEPLDQQPLDQEARTKVAQYWLNKKLHDLEKLVESTAGTYCVGDELSIADFCLIPQMFNARRFKLDVDKFPLLKRIDAKLQLLEIFKVSHPLACPEAPKDS